MLLFLIGGIVIKFLRIICEELLIFLIKWFIFFGFILFFDFLLFMFIFISILYVFFVFVYFFLSLLIC